MSKHISNDELPGKPGSPSGPGSPGGPGGPGSALQGPENAIPYMVLMT